MSRISLSNACLVSKVITRRSLVLPTSPLSLNRSFSTRKTTIPLGQALMPQTRKRPRADETPPADVSNGAPFHSSSRLSMPVPSDTPLFTDLQKKNVLHQDILNTITQELKFTNMMPVQAATVDDLLVHRNDCLVQARTGTGKTLAFLLPAIQSALEAGRVGDGTVPTLILTPTRELALQIAAEARALTTRFPRFKVGISIGGTNKNTEAKNLASTILVATPGRLIDHMSDPRVRNLLGRLQTLVLDEADRMLDIGFLPSIKQILEQLPNKQQVPRHSMLFSATLGTQVEGVTRSILNQGYKFISTIPKGEVQTHDRVPQFSITVPTVVDVAPAFLSAVINEKKSSPQFKAIVFATTAYIAEFYGHVLANTPGMPPVSILHSRLSQSKRTSITTAFRTSQNAICVATDVIARGMDFPNVSHIFQVGLPMDKESYVHRLGRTARAEADGRGIIILSQPEAFFLYQLKDFDLRKYPELPLAREAVANAVQSLENKHKIYQAWIGYYKTSMKPLRWTTAELVRQANVFAIEGLGCEEVPGIEKTTVGKMGLKGVPGLVVTANRPRQNQQSRGGGGFAVGGRDSKGLPSYTESPVHARGGQPGRGAGRDRRPAARKAPVVKKGF